MCLAGSAGRSSSTRRESTSGSSAAKAVNGVHVGTALPARIVDLDGDGRSEAVVVLFFHQSSARVAAAQVHAYSADGTRRWVYDLARELTFGAEAFDGPWRTSDLETVRRDDGRSDVWLSLIHDIWWPSFVISLDPDGRGTLRLVHAGHVYKLARVPSGSRGVVLAAGVNNEYRAASLAVIDPDDTPVVSPQSAPEFTCRDCPAQPRPATCSSPSPRSAARQPSPTTTLICSCPVLTRSGSVRGLFQRCGSARLSSHS